MSDDLYQKAIIELAKRAREMPRLDRPDRSVTIDNPLCGDRVTLDLAFDGESLREAGHRTRGCLLCEASAGLIVEHAPGLATGELDDRAKTLIACFADEGRPLADLWPGLDLLAPARHYKSRHDCVTLPFQALSKALNQGG